MKLVEYSWLTERQYLEYIQEWENGKDPVVPSATCRNGLNFRELISK